MSVTVVVPTRNRGAFVPEVVAALQSQTYTDVRVVVVDDGSSDDTCAVAEKSTEGDQRFRVLSIPNRGPAAARNAGCDEVETTWLAFTDDDCLPEPGWITSLLATAQATGADVVQGRTLPDPSVSRASLPWYSRSQHIGSWSGRFQTCNLLVRTAAFRAVGGFDERFPSEGFGEDTDLGLRLLRHGATPAFDADAIVHHRIMPMGYGEFLRRRYRWAQVVRLVALNPDARKIFPMPYVAYRAHLAFWLAVPVTAWSIRTRRPWMPAVGAVAYGRWQASRSRTKGRSTLVSTAYGTAELGGVAASALGFLVESVRHRKLLL